MGCAGLLARPWNLQAEDALREFLYERGHQFEGIKRRAPNRWTPKTWAKVYEFDRSVDGGWAGHKDGLFAGKFNGEVDPKEGLHPANYRNPRERRMLEFMLPILNPEKPKRLTLTMVNTMFEALSGVQPVSWGLLIHELVARSIPSIRRKPSYLFLSYISTSTMGVPPGRRMISSRLQSRRSTTSSSRWPLTPTRKAITKLWKHIPLHPEGRPQSPGCLTLHPLLLRIIIIALRMLQGPAGHRLRPLGRTWICPRGNFWKTPSNGCLTT